jgi:uncharacterized phage protein gp47/JayE
MILYDMTESQLNAKAESLLAHTDITSTRPGGRAISILSIVNKLLRQLYAALDFNIGMSRVDTATGGFLDAIGMLMNCRRMPGESDDNYRYRITNQVYVMQGANETAILMAARSVPGVLDVIPRKYTFGTGSYSLHVIGENRQATEDLIPKVQEAIDEVSAFGVKGVALAPKPLDLEVWLSVAFSSDVSSGLRSSIALDIAGSLRRHINVMSMGQELILSTIIQMVRNIGGEHVRDIYIMRMQINGKPVFISNYTPHWDEKFYVSSIDNIHIL